MIGSTLANFWFGWGTDSQGGHHRPPIRATLLSVHHTTAMNFSSLTFSDHSVIKGATKAQHTFENGWTISVVAGPQDSGLYGDIQHDTFEVGIIRPQW